MRRSRLIALQFLLVLGGLAPAQDSKPNAFVVRVLDSMLQPIVGAALSVADSDGAVVATGKSGRGGLWSMPARDGWLVCRASLAGYCVGGTALQRQFSRWGRPNDCIRLYDAVTLRGTVRDDRGKPVPLAHVCVDWLHAPNLPRISSRVELPEARCDGLGQFAMAGVPVAGVVLRGWAKGHVLGEQLVQAGATSCDLVVARGRGHELHLQVDGAEFPTGNSVKIRVAWTSSDGVAVRLPAPLRERTFEAAGRLVVSGFPDDGAHVSLTSLAQGGGIEVVPRSAQSRKAGPPGRPLRGPMRFLVHRSEPASASVRGVLRDEAGNVLAGQTIRLRPLGGKVSATRSDDRGRFQFEFAVGPEQGRALHFSLADQGLVLVDPDSARRRAFRTPAYRLEQNAQNAQVELVAAASAEVRGRVRMKNGLLPAGQVVGIELANAAAWGPKIQARVAADGRFVIRGFAALHEPFWLVVDDLFGSGKLGPLRLGDRGDPGKLQGVEVVVVAPVEVRGQVLDANDQPVAGAWVRLVPLPERGPRLTLATCTLSGRDGRYLLRGAKPGSYRLTASLGERAFWSSDAFELASSQKLKQNPRLP